MIIKAEKPGDELAIREINLSAFGQVAEANIVDQPRKMNNVKGVAKYHPKFATAV
jgi:predicted N-acetyltransferase YhbS